MNATVRKSKDRRQLRAFSEKTEVFVQGKDIRELRPVANALANGKLVAFSEGIMRGRRTGDVGKKESKNTFLRMFRLATSAYNPYALRAFLETQGRAAKPRTVQVSSFYFAEKITTFTDEARTLARQFWPGPLTLVLNRSKDPMMSIPVWPGVSETEAGQIGVRMSTNSTLKYMIKETRTPLVTATVCLPVDKENIEAEAEKRLIDQLYNNVHILIRGGNNFKAQQSTVLDLTGDEPVIRRIGEIRAEQIERVLRTDVSIVPQRTTTKVRRGSDNGSN